MDEHDFFTHYISHVVALRQRLLEPQTLPPEPSNIPRPPVLAWRSSELVPEIVATEDVAQVSFEAVVSSGRWQTEESQPQLQKQQQQRLAADLICRLLDCGSPRLIDVILSSMNRDRGDLGVLLSGDEYFNLLSTLIQRVADPDLYLGLSRPVNQVPSTRLREGFFWKCWINAPAHSRRGSARISVQMRSR